MTTIELLQQINLLLSQTESGQYIWDIILTLSNREMLNRSLSEKNLRDRIIRNRRRSNRLNDFIRAWILEPDSPSKERIFLDAVDSKRFFLAMSALEVELDSLTLQLEPLGVPTISEWVRRFAEKYEEYINSGKKDRGLAQEIVSVASQITTQQTSLSRVKTLIEVNLIETVPDSQDTLSLLLKSGHDLPGFIEKLAALNFIYAELCELLKISPKQIPLQIGRVESGSLWARLFGENRVITLMISLIESSVQYLHRNFTTEGKLSALPKGVETISLMLDLEHKLHEAKIDTSEIKDNIQKSSVLISKQLNKLLVGQAVIEINGRRHSVGSELEKAYLDQSKRLLIEDKMDDDDLPG